MQRQYLYSQMVLEFDSAKIETMPLIINVDCNQHICSCINYSGAPERLSAFGACTFPTVITTTIAHDLNEKIVSVNCMMLGSRSRIISLSTRAGPASKRKNNLNCALNKPNDRRSEQGPHNFSFPEPEPHQDDAAPQHGV
jgi:hypothetical protein